MILADHLVLELVLQGYSVELLQTPQYKGVRNTPPPPARPVILSKEVEDLLGKGVVKPVPLDQERSRFYSAYFLVPKSYQFGALLFGLSSAPRIFTKMLAPLVA